MIIIKYIELILLLITSTFIGIIYSKKYAKRLDNLTEIKNALIILRNKIKFTYEPIPDAFEDISSNFKDGIKTIFDDASKQMKNKSASTAWEESIDKNAKNIFLKDEDLKTIKKLSKMLGNTDIDGQVNNIDLVVELLNNQIKDAQTEKAKNEKLYKTLGISVGLTLVIILI